MKSQILLMQPQHNWTPPNGLDHARPRAVVLTAGGKVVLVLAVLLLAGGITAGVALGIAASRGAQEARLLQREGQIADGVVTRVWRAGDEDRQPWISYRFDFRGRYYNRNVEVPLGIWKELRAGSPIRIRFAPSRPDLNHPARLGLERIPPAVPFLVACSLMISSPLLLLLIRRQRRLLAEGRPAPGIVTRHGEMQRGSHGEKRGVKYHYEFSLLSGAIARGSAGPVKIPPAVGSRITVLYDPENPRRSVPYPFPSPLVKLMH
ncbi:MAG: DUF3592 domain-containing protein [Acidobacteriia bacterium]|nr:DUF3592 domain-containing protein [Terriglobia bacterium]